MLSDTILTRIREARHVVVFTGAGVSAESGIPTFRDRFEGLWSQYDPEDVATPHAFRARPQFVWDWHVYLADAVRKARPNAGHEALYGKPLAQEDYEILEAMSSSQLLEERALQPLHTLGRKPCG